MPALCLLGGFDFYRAVLAVHLADTDELTRRTRSMHAAGLLPGFDVLFCPAACRLETVGVELRVAMVVVLGCRWWMGGVVLFFQLEPAAVDEECGQHDERDDGAAAYGTAYNGPQALFFLP